jgi:hypothetical protein
MFMQNANFWLFDRLVRMDCQMTAGKTAEEISFMKRNWVY